MICAAAVNPHIKKSMTPIDFMPVDNNKAGNTDMEEVERVLASMAGVGVA